MFSYTISSLDPKIYDANIYYIDKVVTGWDVKKRTVIFFKDCG